MPVLEAKVLLKMDANWKFKKIRHGCFQITGQNSSEDFSYGGSFNINNKIDSYSCIREEMKF
jgi:hypothetical protein